MTTEAKKKNTDYSASAVKMVNPPEVKELLLAQKARMSSLRELQEKIDSCIPQELKDEFERIQNEIAIEDKGLRGYIDTFGSYQDIEVGDYAVKQRKLSKSYNAESFEKTYPQFSPAVIVKAVDVTKLTGLLKGGLLDEARLEADGVLRISESYAYIIK